MTLNFLIFMLLSVFVVIGCSSSKKQTDPDHVVQFQNALETSIPVLQKCYSKQFPKDKTLESKVYLQFKVNKLGIAENASASAKSFTLNDTVEKCMTDEVKKIKFPLPLHDGGSYNIYQPINFIN